MQCSGLHRGNRSRSYSCVTVFYDLGGSLTIDVCGLWSPGTEAIDIAIAHAEDSSNQNRIVNLHIGRTLNASGGDIPGGYMLSTELHFSGNIQQRFQLERNL